MLPGNAPPGRAGIRGGATAPDIDVVTSEAGFAALAEEWRALWAQDPVAPVWTSFEWHWNAWKLVPRHRGSRLLIVVARNHGEVTLILPMVVDARAGLRRGRWLGGHVAFYEEPVTAPDRIAPLEAAWDAVVAVGRLDCAVFENLRHDGQLHLLAGGVPGRYEHERPLYQVRWSDWEDWDDYWQARTRKLRSDQRRQWRRLAGAGEVAVTCTLGVDDAAMVGDWIVDRKLAWMRSQGKPPGWFGEEAAPFFRAVLAAANDAGRLYAGMLTVGGDPIAMEVGFAQQGGIVAAVTTYDPAWHEFSPGRLLDESCVRHSHDAGYAFYDFLTATSPAEVLHKSKFAEPAVLSSACVLPFSAAGRTYARWFGSRLRRRLRAVYHRRPELRRRHGTRRPR